MLDTHVEMVLNYGVDATVATTEFAMFDMMCFVSLCMELQTKAYNSRNGLA